VVDPPLSCFIVLLRPVPSTCWHTTITASAHLRIQAARATILREVSSVFGAYGIGVDPRHLGLIADFMTHQVSG
jgi:hypothetical protein